MLSTPTGIASFPWFPPVWPYQRAHSAPGASRTTTHSLFPRRIEKTNRRDGAGDRTVWPLEPFGDGTVTRSLTGW